MVRPVVPPSKVHVGDPTALKPNDTDNNTGKSSKKSASAKDKSHAPRAGIRMKKKEAKPPKESVVLSDGEAAKKIRKKKRKDGPSRSKQKKLARKMLALQRSTDPLLTKTVIKELAGDAAPGLRFTKSAREALRYAVEAYAQGEHRRCFGRESAQRAWAGPGEHCCCLGKRNRGGAGLIRVCVCAGIFEASNTIRGTSDEKTLGVKHMKAALQMEELLTGNGHPDFRLTA